MLSKNEVTYIIFLHVGRILTKKILNKVLALNSKLTYTRLILISEKCILNHYVTNTLFNNRFVIASMNPPNLLHLKRILYKKFADQCANEELFSNFLSIVYQEFSPYVMSIKYFEYLCRELLYVYIRNYDGISAVFENCYSQEFKHEMRNKLCNLFVPIITEHKELGKHIENISSPQVNDRSETLVYIQGVILVSAYIACNSPIKNDIKLFGQCPIKKAKLKKQTNTKPTTKKAEIERIISIAEYFLALKQSEWIEKNLFAHSSFFYTQINSLVQSGYLKTDTSNLFDASNLCYSVGSDISLIQQVAKDVDIKIGEYLIL